MHADEIRQKVMGYTQGTALLNIAYIGIVNRLFEKLAKTGPLTASDLAQQAGVDKGYVVRWCDTGYAFDLLDETDDGLFSLTEAGHMFLPDVPGTLMPFAVGAVLGTHMAERAAGLMPGGERPGEKVLGERGTVLPWFGPMLEKMFGPFLDNEIIPNVPVYQEVDARGGLAVDLGCGNGWYLRTLARRLPQLRAIGLDGFGENIRQANAMAEAEAMAGRVSFREGDIYNFSIDEKADLIAMNRALHHVWDQKEKVFSILAKHLKDDGVVIIWEPNWPVMRSRLREPDKRMMAFQNLSEHVQGNHFLRPEEIADQFRAVGLEPEVYLFGNDRESVVVGRKA
ncbi:MAG: methyltransferase domain-containing protein [Gammaproteobacteria bacterium]|nr:methyltransferase domain-containing protein [Gammaproteobacteria bacterium]MDH5651740.1 methyltransferase domain-containing protein [Gammaproteobacteria bacterium]